MKGASGLFRLLIGIWIFAVSGCEALDKEEPFPVYLKLEQPEIKLTPNFTTDLGVKDLWIDAGPEPVGIYRVPAVIPYLPGNADSLIISGGVFETGLSASRIRYPFWQPVKIFVDASPLDTFVLKPTFEYYPDTLLTFPLEEGFEGASIGFEDLKTTTVGTSIAPTAQKAYLGRHSGRVLFSESSYDFEVVATDFIALPQTGSNDIYVEITYQNTIPFSVGLYYASGFDISVIPINLVFISENEWNTVYVHINDQVRGAPRGARFKLFIRANSFDVNANRGRPGELFLDNIRIVHFK